MFHIDNSLRLNSAQPKIKHLRRQIGEEGDLEYYDADMWDSALADMMRKHRKSSNDAKMKNPEKDPLAPADKPVAAVPTPTAPPAETLESGISITSNTQADESVDVTSLLDEIESSNDFNYKEEAVVAVEDVRPETETTPTMPFVSMMNGTDIAEKNSIEDVQSGEMSPRPVQPAMKKLWWFDTA